MTFISTRAALIAAARLIPADRSRKDAATIEQLLEQHAEAMAKAIAGVDLKAETVKAELFDISQKMAQSRRGGGGSFFGSDASDTWGRQFINAKSGDLAGMNRSDRVAMEIKASITSATTDTAGSAGDLVVPARDQVIGMPKRRLTIRDLLNVKPITSGSVERPKQVSRATGAAPVAEGAVKPSSDMQFKLETVPTRVIAHWVKASRQILEDVPQLESMIDVELRYGLALEEEDQLLNGNGTGQNLKGMNNVATDFNPDVLDITAPNAIDKIGMAILQASLTDIAPDGIIMHPSDWWRIRLTKGPDGKYLLGDPGKVVAPSLFGLPVVPTPSQTVDNFLVGSFGSQTLYDRWSARVELGFVDDDFTRNLVTILGEERVGFDPERPEALIAGTFTEAP